MSEFRIFVEGVADKVFIRQYIAFIKGVAIGDISEKEIIQCEGRANLWSQDEFKSKLSEAIEKEITPLIIFDADASAEDTRGEITNELAAIDIPSNQYALFLFPNNQDAGDLETLLEHIIPPKNQHILSCWEQYEECLRHYATPKVRPSPLPPLTTPARKTKIYGYLEALLGTSKAEKKKTKEASREYRNAEHWDLKANYLNPLKQFLLTYLQDDSAVQSETPC